MTLQPGDIVLQRDAPEMHPIDYVIRLKSPNFSHCGIVVDNIGGVPVMIAASLGFGGVDFQSVRDIGALDLSCEFSWKNFGRVKKWLVSKIGCKYDLGAYWEALTGYEESIPGDKFICSNFVGEALNRFGGYRKPVAYRGSTPDDIARVLGVL